MKINYICSQLLTYVIIRMMKFDQTSTTYLRIIYEIQNFLPLCKSIAMSGSLAHFSKSLSSTSSPKAEPAFRDPKDTRRCATKSRNKSSRALST